MCSKSLTEKSTPVSSASDAKSAALARAAALIRECDALCVGAGAGLSASAGFDYAGARFDRYFADFAASRGFSDMYSGGFYPFPTPEETWAFWSRMIYVNRYMDPPRPVYPALLRLVGGRDYFVITSNVDHCFQKAGFDRARLFYTQGDYGLFQCSVPCHAATYDNEETVRRMLTAQRFAFGPEGELVPPDGPPLQRVPRNLIPRCPRCGRPMTVNLRSGDTFVEDAGWRAAEERWSAFTRAHRSGRVVYLELGVGYNTPGIVKYPFMIATYKNPDAAYVCLNFQKGRVPGEIADRSVFLEGDIGDSLASLESAP